MKEAYDQLIWESDQPAAARNAARQRLETAGRMVDTKRYPPT